MIFYGIINILKRRGDAPDEETLEVSGADS